MIKQNTLVRNGQNPFRKIRQDLMRTDTLTMNYFRDKTLIGNGQNTLKKVGKTPVLDRILREGLNTLITDRTFC